jgi:precorrin-6A/cobalt-precorrin-6A reductase
MILILGGTTEGRELALKLQRIGYACVLSVASELGAKMYDNTVIRTQIGELDFNSLKELLQREHIKLLIDATHPYAVVIKEIARNAAEAAGVIYSRLEREPALLPDDPHVVITEDYADAFEVLRNDHSGVLFTIGVKNLYFFRSLWADKGRPVWVKIYPETKSIEACRELGLRPEQIIAFHGHGTQEVLKAIIGMTGVSWIVTKESGSIGGIDVKIAATMEMGKKILVIKRPLNEAGLVFQSISEVVEFIRVNKEIQNANHPPTPSSRKGRL